ncbi:hypothetical protein ACWDO7_09225 [Streptomyces sp. NPDC003656]
MQRVQAALSEAERALQCLVDAQGTVVQVLAEPPSALTNSVRSAVAGSVVPHWCEGMEVSVLVPDYQRFVSMLELEVG